MVYLILISIVLSLPLIGQNDSHSPQTEPFSIVINRPSYTAYSRWMHLIYSEIFKRMEIPLIINYMPMKRATFELVRGKVDAEPGRIYEYADHYPNLIRIEEPVFYMTVSIFTTNQVYSETLQGWESLKGVDGKMVFPGA